MRLAGLCVALGLLCASAASAHAQSAAQRIPFDRLATHVIAISPPAQWKVTSFTVDRFLIEQGELSPRDQTPMFWRDQIGYVAVPSAEGSADSTSAADGIEQTCARSYRMTTVTPRAAKSGDAWIALICLVGIAAPDAIPQAPVEIIVFNSRVAGDGAFLYWRAWRGGLNEAPAMFARHHAQVAPVPANPSSADFAAWASGMPHLIEDFAAEIDRTLTICDLAGAHPCAGLHVAASHKPANAIAVFAVQGSAASASPGSLAADHDMPADQSDFSTPDVAHALSDAINAAHAGGGGVISLSGGGDPAHAAQLRAYLLRLGRQRVSAGALDADALSFDLWPGVR